jgi:transposase
MPREYGCWQTVYKRHNRWSKDGTWARILDHLRAGCDEGEGAEWTIGVDSTVVRAHQHAAGARRPPVSEDHTNDGTKEHTEERVEDHTGGWAE